MKKLFVERNFRLAAHKIIEQVNEIVSEYSNELTVRQIYYQFVSRGLFPDDRRWKWINNKWKRDPNGSKNAQPNYTWLAGIINKARLAGLIDWDSFVDRLRIIQKNSHWENPADIIETCARQFRLDTRWNQDYYIEVWIEKDALIGVIESTCKELDVPYFACRGFVSQSAMYEAALRIKARRQSKAIILHLGDHDPSGLDMTRDITDRLNLFESGAMVRRIALTMEQIKLYNPPHDPARVTDSRYEKYRKEYGENSWELDALEPFFLTELIKTEVSSCTAKRRRSKVIKEQMADRRSLAKLSSNWDNIEVVLEEYDE